MDQCKHCRKVIQYGWATGWVHSASRSVFCDSSGTKMAERK